jgi:tRNA threonylcarbamoyladenosine biosynthesis protein TsaB
VTVLGVESATSVCAAAVVVDGRVAAEAVLDSQNIHAERLVGQIDDVFHRSGIALRFVDVIAVSIGPGSFTGLRIGVSVSKGLAYAASLPMIGVPTLAALALHAAEVDGIPDGAAILSALDARRDEIYCQLFVRQGGEVTPVWDAAAMTVAELGRVVGDREVVVAGNAALKVIAAFPGPARAASAEASRCSALAVALLGGAMMRTGGPDNAATLEPRYIKDFFLKTR